MTLPNALLFGTVKAGTSSLYNYLRQHPDIYASFTKEPNFFAFIGQPPQFAGPHDDIINVKSVTDRRDYEALFDQATNQRIILEGSVLYLYHQAAPLHIKQHIPDVKLFAMLRNPADRAFSSYLHTVRDGRETARSFSEALELEPQRIAANWGHMFHYRQMGFYCEQLKRYYALFPKEQIGVFLYDDFVKEPLAVIGDIFRFLEVDDTFVPDISMRYNVSGTSKSKVFQQFLTRPHRVKDVLKRFVPRGVRGDRMLNFLMQLNTTSQRPVMSSEQRQQLIRSYYDDMNRLQDLVGIDLTSWLS